MMCFLMKILDIRKRSVCIHLAPLSFCIVSTCFACATQASVAVAHTTSSARIVSHRKHAESSKVVAPVPSQLKPSDTNAVPAKVILNDGILTVKANNSDLSQILSDVAGMSGMSIDGSIRSVRVFGVYGPGNSRDVLTDLLTGLGYNFMMAGLTREGAPKQLLLTPQTGAATPPPPPTAHENTDESSYDDNHPGPGAIVHLPPPPPEDPAERMQQHMQRLQQMHGQPLDEPAPQ